MNRRRIAFIATGALISLVAGAQTAAWSLASLPPSTGLSGQATVASAADPPAMVASTNTTDQFGAVPPPIDATPPPTAAPLPPPAAAERDGPRPDGDEPAYSADAAPTAPDARQPVDETAPPPPDGPISPGAVEAEPVAAAQDASGPQPSSMDEVKNSGATIRY